MFQGLSLPPTLSGDVPRPTQENPRRGCKEGGSDGNWETFCFWTSNEIPPERLFSGSDHEKNTLALCQHELLGS